MIKFNWNNKNWTVRFAHLYNENPNAENQCMPTGTIVSIQDDADPLNEYEGFAYCHIGLDQFDAEKGRKLSLKRALDVMDTIGMNKEGRKIVWDAYINRPKRRKDIHYRVVS